MPSQGALSSVSSLALKILFSIFKHLYLFECVFLQVQLVCKDNFHFLFACVYLTPATIFFTKKSSAIIIVCSGLERAFFIFYWEERIVNPLFRHRLDIELRRRK